MLQLQCSVYCAVAIMQGAHTAGRPGTAYSLLTREELPYLLDLHLFLSRPVQAAPELPLAGAAAAAERPDSGASVYGTFPQVGAWLCSKRCLCGLPLGDTSCQALDTLLAGGIAK